MISVHPKVDFNVDYSSRLYLMKYGRIVVNCKCIAPLYRKFSDLLDEVLATLWTSHGQIWPPRVTVFCSSCYSWFLITVHMHQKSLKTINKGQPLGIVNCSLLNQTCRCLVGEKISQKSVCIEKLHFRTMRLWRRDPYCKFHMYAAC